MAASSLLAEPSGERGQGIIDEAHLGRMTLGDRSLEREVLEIFARQTVLMLKRIAGADLALAAAAAHTLKGSARGIGAWRVAQAAEAVERAAGEDDDKTFSAAISELEAASLEVRAAIGVRLGDDWDAPEAVARTGRSRDH